MTVPISHPYHLNNMIFQVKKDSQQEEEVRKLILSIENWLDHVK